MAIRSATTAAAVTAILFTLFPSGQALACSVCLAGDARFSQQGASAQEQGDFSLFLQLRGWRKTSGLLPGELGGEPEVPGVVPEEANRSRRIDLYLSWTPLDRLTLTLDLPTTFIEIVESDAEGRSRATHAGVGDISLFGSFVVWRDRDRLPSRWLEARAMLKAPTGESRRRIRGVRDPHLQVGTGSWDFGFGLAAAQRLSWGSLYLSGSYRENSKGSLDYEYGNVVLASASVEVPLGHALGWASLDAFTPGFSLDFRYAGFDRTEGERFVHSGGSILYATPSLRVRLPFRRGALAPSLSTSVQLPLGQTWLNNQQREREVWSVGLLVPF